MTSWSNQSKHSTSWSSGAKTASSWSNVARSLSTGLWSSATSPWLESLPWQFAAPGLTTWSSTSKS